MQRDPDQQAPASSPTGAPSFHQSYLLRLWRGSADGEWRASLQSVQSGERHSFADVDSLLAFLVEVALRPPPP